MAEGKCHKQGFRSQRIAEQVLTYLRDFRGRAECRIYRCPRCSRWHLTSAEEES